jgi:cellulose synthase (UDP-forming)
MMVLTMGGLAINATVEFRIVEQRALIPIVAFWSIINIIVMILICMLCLQVPIQRKEERFNIDDPVWLRHPDGSIEVGRISNISLSGAALHLQTDDGEFEAPPIGSTLRVFLPEVGFVHAAVARSGNGLIGIHFDLSASIERDLLIRKLFTNDMNTLTETKGLFHVSLGLLKSIWTMQNIKAASQPEAVVEPAEEILSPRSRVIEPNIEPKKLTKIAEQRRQLAA